MKKNTKILIIGYGSIGQRHYNNLSKFGFNNVYIFDIDSSKLIGKNLKIIEQIDVKKLSQFNIVFICNPNNSHIKTAIQCAKAGCHLFIEKPLSHNLAGLKKLQKICDEKKLITMIGCNMRFHPCLIFIKKYLDKNRLGKIYSISHEFGYYLPYWRPRQDYRKNYAVKKEAGGGIILDDIHEFDLLFWLNDFFPVKESSFIFDKAGKLEMETENICVASFNFKNKILGTIRCDYLQQHYSRNCKIVGEKGNLEWDFTENIVWLKNKQGQKKLFEIKNFDFNNVYIDEVRYFFDCIEKKKKTYNDIGTASKILTYCVKKK